MELRNEEIIKCASCGREIVKKVFKRYNFSESFFHPAIEFFCQKCGQILKEKEDLEDNGTT